MGDRGQTHTLVPREASRHEPIHPCSPGAGWSSHGKGGCSPSTRHRGDAGQELLLSEATGEGLWLREWHCCHQRALAGTADNNPGRGELQDLARPSLLSNLAVPGAEKSSGNCLSKAPCHPSTDSSGPFTGAKSQSQSPLKSGGKLTGNSMGFA